MSSHNSAFVLPSEGMRCQLQVLVTEKPKQWYHFLTTTCAIIGGVFTVCGILDGLSFSAQRIMKKVELGKQG
jgi:hypothetical protein